MLAVNSRKRQKGKEGKKLRKKERKKIALVISDSPKSNRQLKSTRVKVSFVYRCSLEAGTRTLWRVSH